MESWHTAERVAFDLETTGRDPDSARIVSATVLLCDHESAVLQEDYWLVDPGVEVPAESTAIHGFSTEHVRAHGIPAAVAVPAIAEKIFGYFRAGIPVVAFNASYDLTVLLQEMKRLGIPTSFAPRPVLDAYIMDKQLDRYRRGKRTLSDVCSFWGINLQDAHNSTADALAAAQVAQSLAQRYPDAQLPAEQLHDLQVGWAADQSRSLAEYFQRKGIDRTVTHRTWPVEIS